MRPIIAFAILCLALGTASRSRNFLADPRLRADGQRRHFASLVKSNCPSAAATGLRAPPKHKDVADNCERNGPTAICSTTVSIIPAS